MQMSSNPKWACKTNRINHFFLSVHIYGLQKLSKLLCGNFHIYLHTHTGKPTATISSAFGFVLIWWVRRKSWNDTCYSNAVWLPGCTVCTLCALHIAQCTYFDHIRDGQNNLFLSFYLQMCVCVRDKSKLKQMKLALFKSVNFIVVFSCFSIFILIKWNRYSPPSQTAMNEKLFADWDAKMLH